MKRILALDLGAARAEVASIVDAWFGRQATMRWPLAVIHGAKVRAASVDRADDTHPLAGEAASRNLTLPELCAAIHANAAAADADLLALDAQRMNVKRELAAATSGQQIEAIRNRFT